VMKEFNLVIAGVGGQGSILSSHIVGDAAIRDGYQVRVAETYGAAMRGGAVMGQIRIGRDVQEPLILVDKADALLALEPLEALRRGIRYLSPHGVALINTRQVPPVDVNVGRAHYPTIKEIEHKIGALTKHVITVDGTGLAEKAGHDRTLNVVMIGALKGTGIFPLSQESIEAAITDRVPQGTIDVNLKAFKLGMDATANIEALARKN